MSEKIELELELACRSKGDIQEAAQVATGGAATSFRDVRTNGDGRALDLTRQVEPLLGWKGLRDCIYFQRELAGGLVNLKPTMVLHAREY